MIMDSKSKTQLEYLLATLDNLNDAILVVDHDGKVLYTNHGFEKLFKHLVGDIVDWTFEEMGTEFDVYDVNGQFLPPSQWPFVRIMQDEKVFQEKYKVVFKADNKISLFIQISGGPIKQVNSTEKYSLISISDITIQETNYLLLQEKEKSYRKLFLDNPQPMWIFDLDTIRFLEVNNAALVHYGYSKEEFLNLSIEAIIHEEDLPKIVEELQKPGQPILHNAGIRRHYKKNGEIIDVEVTSHYLTYNGKKVILSMPYDITKRKLNEEKVRVAFTKYKTLFDNLPIGISISDHEGKIIETNSVAGDLLGITEEEHKKRIINDKNWQIFRTDGTPMPAEEYASVRAINTGKKVENVEMGILKPDHNITWVNVTAAPFPIENYGVIVTFNDITKRREAEKQLMESEQRFANIFHDSPIPIAIIRLRNGEIVIANPAVTNFLGYTHEELIGNTTLALGIWADTNERQEFTKKMQTETRIHVKEAVLCLKSGEKRHALMWGYA